MALGPENARAKHNQSAVRGGQILDGLISCEEGYILTADQLNELRAAWEAVKGYRIDGYARPHVNRLVKVVGSLLPATEPAETYECEFRCEEGIARAGVGVRCPACTAAMRAKESAEPGEGPKARCPSAISGWGCSLTCGHAGDHIAHDQDGPTYIWPASSPDVSFLEDAGPRYCPACKLNVPNAPYCTNCGRDTLPDSGGSWPTWNDVPDGIWFTRNGLGPIVANRKRGALVDCRRRDGSTLVMPIPESFAGNPSGPFVPVEVEL
ncbi:hypothetical protein G8767_17180 [Rhodococcus sp. IC4_135]|uniref:hypothetical protein n=1 Tax=Rhodococcus sp. IC4_135 TaxID=2715537 RepID=UPI00141EB86F|nr:hypothetical protein [Rhodococcus sp. IC4_135]